MTCTQIWISGKCKVTLYGSEYLGTINRTVSGRLCQRWDSQTPQQHNQDVADYFPDATLADAADYCRNPNNPFIPRTSWCYTVDPDQRREYCDIPYCLGTVSALPLALCLINNNLTFFCVLKGNSTENEADLTPFHSSIRFCYSVKLNKSC